MTGEVSSRMTDRMNDRPTRNPRCACAPRVNHSSEQRCSCDNNLRQHILSISETGKYRVMKLGEVKETYDFDNGYQHVKNSNIIVQYNNLTPYNIITSIY